MQRVSIAIIGAGMKGRTAAFAKVKAGCEGEHPDGHDVSIDK